MFITMHIWQLKVS